MTKIEIIKIAVTMEDETYERIVELLDECDIYGNYFYTVEEIAEMFGVAREVVEYIDRVEHNDC